MTTIYLATLGRSPEADPLLEAWPWEEKPLSILVSHAYLAGWSRIKDKIRPASRMLDSGAYTAYTSGKTVDIDALVVEALRPEWDEAVGLDVIGDAEGSRANMDRMLAAGCAKAMPVFHIGDPWELLAYYASRWSKIGLSCRFGEDKATSLRFYEQCFARAWPKRFHSFGWAEDDALLRFPFHSADASSWRLGPLKYGIHMTRKHGRFVRHQIPNSHSFETRQHGLRTMLEAEWLRTLTLRALWAKPLAQIASAA